MRQIKYTSIAAAVSAMLLSTANVNAADRITVAWFGGAWADGFQECIADPFTKETGIEVMPEIGTSTVTLAKLKQQKGAPTIDVAWIDAGISEIANEEGLVDDLSVDSIPNLKNVEESAVYSKDGKNYAVSTGFFSIGLTYSTDDVAEKPDSWKVLWDDEYAGAVTIPSPANSAGVPYILFLTKVWGGDTDNLDPVFEKLKGLDASLFFDSSGAATNAFQNGEAIIGAHYSTSAWEMIDKGLPIGFTVPEEGVWAGDGRLHLVKDTANKEAAQKFINTALTAEAASCLADRLYLGPVVKGATVSDEAAPKLPWGEHGSIDDLVLFDWELMNSARAEITDIWNREIAGN